MDDVTPYTSVEPILEELAYLSLRRHELVVENKAQIGVGGYGEVLSAKLRKPNEKDVDVAVKCVWAVGTMGDRRRFAMRFARELKIWASIRHLNILPLVGFYLSHNYEIAQLVSPLLANGNVTQYISRTKPQREKRMGFVCDIAAGLDFLHNHSPPVCHGDLKPANVLVSDSYEAILCDFGLASLVDKSGAASGLTTSRSIKGSTRYMSPELILGTDEKYTLASDVWAWACTTFEIITDCAPYSEAIGEPQIMLAIIRGEAPGHVRMLMEGADSDGDSGLGSLATSRSLLSSVSTCWSFTPIGRPTMREIVEQLFPTLDRNSPRRGASRIGSVRVRSRVLVDSSLRSAIVGPGVRIIINGVCKGIASFDAAMHDGNSIFLDVEVEVQNVREVIVLEAAYLLDGTKRILGTVGIDVKDLAIRNSGSIVQLHHYALRRLEGQISMEYKLEFTQKLAVPGSIQGSNPDDFDISRSASSGVGSFDTAKLAHSDRNQDPKLNHKKSGSLGGAVGNLVAGLKGSTWSASNHPYANATAAYDGDDQPSSSTGYKVGRGPFGKSGHHHQTSGGNPLSLEDVKRRTIKVTMGDIGRRTIDISDCDTGIGVLQAALKKFGKGSGLGHGDDDGFSGETEQGGLVVGGWAMFVDGVIDESLVKPLNEAELLNIRHSDGNSPARARLTLRRVRKGSKLNGSFRKKSPPRPIRVPQRGPTYASRIKDTPFDDSDNSGNNSLAVPGRNSPTPRPNASSKKMHHASKVPIKYELGAGPIWSGLANLADLPPTPPVGAPMAASVTMEARSQPSVGKEATKKLRNFFGQSPPSDIIYTHQQDFFPTVEKKVLERTAIARQIIFGGNTGANSKRMTTISALSGGGIGGGSDDGGRRSISSNRHRSRFSVSSNGSALTPAQALAVANNPNIPPVPSPPYPPPKAHSTRFRVSIEEPLPRMSVSTEDGKSVDLNSDEDLPPPTPRLPPPVSVKGETLSESLSGDFAHSPLLQGRTSGNKRTSFSQELRSKQSTSDTTDMLKLDEIAKKVESWRQGVIEVGTSDGTRGIGNVLDQDMR